MNRFPLFVRSVLGTATAALILAGCSAPQSGFGALPRSAPGFGDSAIQPNVACPALDKIFTTGKGHAHSRFDASTFAAGSHLYTIKVHLSITKWPDGHKLPGTTFQLSTCGPQSGHKPVGKIVNGPSSLGVSCKNGFCDYSFDETAKYQPPLTLGMPWKYDELLVKFKTPQKGWGALPSHRIEITK